MLEIESGRRKKILYENRLCKQCSKSASIEDEYHFIMECNKYAEGRKELFAEINDYDKSFLSLIDNRQMFEYIMTYKSNMASILIFIKNSLNIRYNSNN